MYQPSAFDPPWITFFCRPCPSWVRKHEGTFQFFPALPKELQLMIWDYAVAGEHRQLVVFHNSGFPPYYTANNPELYARGIKYKPPSLLHVSYDARCAGLKAYVPSFSLELGHPIYFDFSKDAFYFKHWDAFAAFVNSTAEPSTDADRVDIVIFEPPIQMRHTALVQVCRQFSGLNSLCLFEHEPALVNPPTSPVTCMPTRTLPSDFRLKFPVTLFRILAALQGRKMDISRYQPPIVYRGTRSQWMARGQRVRAEMENHMDWEITR